MQGHPYYIRVFLSGLVFQVEMTRKKNIASCSYMIISRLNNNGLQITSVRAVLNTYFVTDH